MKKLAILAACLLLAPSVSFAQDEMPEEEATLLIDKPTQNGYRLMGTDYEYIRSGFTDTHPFGFSIMAKTKTEGETEYYLGVRISTQENYQIPKGGLLLIKTMENEVIELKQSLDKHKTDDLLGNTVAGVRVRVIKGIYPISHDDLSKLVEHGIIKVRMETVIDVLDSEYKPKKAASFAKKLQALYNVIQKHMDDPKDIRDGF